MDNENIVVLIKSASKLIETDKKVVKAIVESDFNILKELFEDFRSYKIKVQKGLSQVSVIENVDASTKEILARVQRSFPTEVVIKRLEGTSDDDDAFLELTDAEITELGSDLLYSWISHYEYVRNIFKINTLILKTKISNELRQYVQEVRNCFALEQYNAVISLCRTILEAAAKNICEKKGFFKNGGGIIKRKMG